LPRRAFTASALLALIPNARAAAADGVPVGHTRIEMQIGGRPRRALLFTPPTTDASAARPLVVMLHGMGGSGIGAMEETMWSNKARAEGFVVAYPDATRPHESAPRALQRNPPAWNDGSGRFHAGQERVDDVGFIRALIAKCIAEFQVDAKRVFVTGFSNGASMTFRLGAELAATVAAIAPVAGSCWTEPLALARGVSLLYVTGTADPLNPIEGGYPKLARSNKEQGGERKPPVQTMIDKWVRANGCQSTPTLDTAGDVSRTRRQVYRGGRNGAEVIYIAIEAHGHHWPGGNSKMPEWLVGKNASRLSATDEAWAFFVDATRLPR
jgi:polyhydroxybutyrate depolymerase